MKTTKSIRFSSSIWGSSSCRIARGVGIFLFTVILVAGSAGAANLKVMKMGLGSGTVTSSVGGINCGASCDATFGSPVSVTLTATADMGSIFVRWDGDADPDPSTVPDCTGSSTTCTLSMSADRSVRPVFDLTPGISLLSSFTPAGIQAYLTANPAVNSPARFLKALPDEYKRNWILMSRSESLQTGTAESPRILLPSANAQSVFSIGMTTHSSYPGAHPNAIEYMQWDATEKNFRFHEIVLDAIPAMGSIPPRSRGVSIDDAKCSKCHSTRNVLNPSSFPGTTGIPPGSVKAKSKPNWDSYDSWGGMMPFNRDRIYQGSVEAATFRKIFNPWTWRTNDSVRSIIEQLRLQPDSVPPVEVITRTSGGTNDGHVNFAFDVSPPVLTEPPPSGTSTAAVTYSFDRVAGTPPGTNVTRGGSYVTLRHTFDVATTGLNVEGRGVHLFDLLGGLYGNLNAQRIADELVNHRFATGSVPIDVRPTALAIIRPQSCLSISGTTAVSNPSISGLPPLTINSAFFDSRNGMTIDVLFADTTTRAQLLPRRKADIEKLNLDRTGDPYLVSATNGLIQQYGTTTSAGTDTSMSRLRQEVFRRPNDLGRPDATVMGGIYVDRELYTSNTERVALLRYFLEPLGVSIDKWSMGVRGRSRTYTFADVFGAYQNILQPQLEASLTSNPVPGLTNPGDCGQLITAINNTLSSLPPANAAPTYTDVQRIFNKSCIECHGGLGYPPYGTGSLDFSEDENPPATTPPMVSPRLARSYGNALAYTTTDPTTSYLYTLITRVDETCPPAGVGLMPCGGPPLSKTDIETIRRWIVGPSPSRPSTAGDPHIKTVDGTSYDFQSAGEFVLLRDENLEVQARQTAVSTDGPLPPNSHTGLSSCVSINTAVAVRIGPHRITYEPNLQGQPSPEGLELRIDGKLTRMGQEILLPAGGRIDASTAPGGLQIEAPGGTVVVITPGWWDYYRVWYLNIDVQHPRATQGVMGAIAPGNWLPALPDGSLMGPRPPDLHQRYVALYQKFDSAWRVIDATSLFDYAPGTSTATFTLRGWPAETPRSCIVPAQPEGPPPKPPVKALPIEVARQHCSAIVANDRRANCENDVMITGEPGFAKTYLLTEQIERNTPPNAPVLTFPADGQTGLAIPIKFTWNSAVDPDGDPVTYRYCAWISLDTPTFNNCDPTSIQTPSPHRGIVCALLVALLGCLLIAVLFLFGLKRRRSLLGLLAVALLAAVVVAFYVGTTGSKTISKTVSRLEPGKTYLWKVIAEDGKGGTTESQTRRFTPK